MIPWWESQLKLTIADGEAIARSISEDRGLQLRGHWSNPSGRIKGKSNKLQYSFHIIIIINIELRQFCLGELRLSC